MRDSIQILFGLLVATTGGLMAGLLLASSVGMIELVPGLLILLPGFMELRGNISGALSARLSTALHLGTIKPKVLHRRGKPIIRDNIVASFILVLVVSAVLGFVATGVSYFLFGVNKLTLVYISVTAALISNIVLLPSTIMFCFLIFRHKMDPDNVMGPYVTTVGDVVSVLSLLLAIIIFT